MNRFEQAMTSLAGSPAGVLDFEWLEIRKGTDHGRAEVPFSSQTTKWVTVVALTGSACGSGCLSFLSDGARSFAAAELKTNFIGAVRNHFVVCEAHRVYSGSTTQVLNAEICSEKEGRMITLNRCMLTLLYQSYGGVI